MNASQFLIVVSLLILPPFAHAEFDPDSLTNLIVIKDAPCEVFSAPYYCVEVKKDEERYLIVLKTDREAIEMIFLIKGKYLELVWGNWI